MGTGTLVAQISAEHGGSGFRNAFWWRPRGGRGQEGTVFDIDRLISDCREAAADPEPRQAVREVLERCVRSPEAVQRALPAIRAEIAPLYVSDELTVLKVVWAPGMRFRPHDHRMWAALALYGGQERNTFYRRSGGAIAVTGERTLRTGEVAVLGADAIHAVTNPERCFTGAIHVYGGDITRRPGRREWEEPSMREVDYDFERTRRAFERANAAR
jgi:predicted metal-dependent enzyme (double-stranded beta helix superfamily)